MRRVVIGVTVSVLALAGCGGGELEAVTPSGSVVTTAAEPTRSSTPSPTEEKLSAADQALALTVCHSYGDAVVSMSQMVNDMLDPEVPATAMIYYITLSEEALEAVEPLAASAPAPLDEPFGQVEAAISLFVAKANAWQAGTFDIGAELAAYQAADDAVNDGCEDLDVPVATPA